MLLLYHLEILNLCKGDLHFNLSFSPTNSWLYSYDYAILTSHFVSSEFQFGEPKHDLNNIFIPGLTSK